MAGIAQNANERDLARTEVSMRITANERVREQHVRDAVIPLDDLQDDRGKWSAKGDFIMSLLAFSLGLGNVWRFPYLVYSNGGGACVILFVLMLVVLGIPLMFLELAFGQYAALGPAAIFDRFCPLFHGLGFGMISVSATVSLYYAVIIGWCILYLFMSFTAELPWEKCRPEWATDCEQ